MDDSAKNKLPEDEKVTLPFSKWYPLAYGIGFGLFMRLVVFNDLHKTEFARQYEPYLNWLSFFPAMFGSFIYLVPFAVGAITVYVAEKTERRSWYYYFYASFLANVFLVLGTLIIYIEGMICAVVIVPLVAVVGSLGGIVMGAICRYTGKPHKTLYGFMALPLLLANVEQHIELPTEQPKIERTIHIAAKPSVVWHQINKADSIQPAEVGAAWAYRIGVPMPLSGITIENGSGMVRKIRMAKDVHFDQVIVDWQPNQLLKSTYKFYPDSFPVGALDDHVVIGGHYFDLLDTTYTLTEKDGGTDLGIQVHYRISTQFNLYANWVAKLLLGNFEETILQFYRRRSEASSKG